MNWSELKNNKTKSHLFLNYLKNKADKLVKHTKCHLCVKSFGYKCSLVGKWKLFELQHKKSADWQSQILDFWICTRELLYSMMGHNYIGY